MSVLSFATGLLSSSSHIRRVRHDVHRREVRVSRVHRLSAGFLAITFEGDALANFVSMSFDDHVKLIFQDASGNSHKRDFTPRHFDLARREITLEFALHEHGAACEWARNAIAGDSAVIAGPRGSMIIPTDFEWNVMVGDASAMPAIHRRLEEFPEGSPVQVFALVHSSEDQRTFCSQAKLQVHWVRSSNELLHALGQWTVPSGLGFAWCAGEASTMTRVRALLTNEKKLSREAMRVSAYWKQGATDFHEPAEG